MIRRQQELNDLSRRKTQQAQARQRKGFDKKNSWCKSSLGRRLRMGISERYTTEVKEKVPKKWRRTFMITEVHQEGRFYRLSTGRAAHYENIKQTNHRQKTGVYLQTWKRGII